MKKINKEIVNNQDKNKTSVKKSFNKFSWKWEDFMKFNINASKKFHHYLLSIRFYRSLLRVFLTLAFMFIATFIVLWCLGKNPFAYYGDVFRGSLSSGATFADTLGLAGILIFTSLAFAVPSKVKLFNIGISGQMMIAGAFTYLLVQIIFQKWNYSGHQNYGNLLPLNETHHFVELIFILFSCIIISMIWASIPGMLKAFFNANEVVSTIMFNWIAVAFYRWVLTSKEFNFYDNTSGASFNLSPNALFRFKGLHDQIYGTSAGIGFFSIAIFVAIGVAIFFKIYLSKTTSGYAINLTGASSKAAKLSGVHPKWIIINSMLFSGLFSGFAAAFFYFGIYASLGNVAAPILYGFLAIAVSLVGNNNSIAIIFASLFFGVILAGQGYSESGKSGITVNFGYVIFAVTIFCTIAATIFVKAAFKRGWFTKNYWSSKKGSFNKLHKDKKITQANITALKINESSLNKKPLAKKTSSATIGNLKPTSSALKGGRRD